ncbi:formimidoyltransferase-cyclodeaminase-like [Chlorella sorokiniana]|uniref:glutamate formimidoyltransferase n=1 Tax=Chlorella sorokiniana TaxID=3076 RepID=A0A2P6TQF4_CHLSO|nr:formimidoyltransferase-cyclodeaminase-like [Chlorella sorokiniana]|eukprot:PRW56268.1 formimidoyltransferase-cyclodeaminase-like [Chlorella sorokiniana]
MYFACAVYVSEAREAATVERLERLARSASGACLANLFVDEPYNRTNFTLVGRSQPQLTAAVVALAQEALQLLDLRQHTATHPRLGTVDHISCHPLTALPPAVAAGTAAGSEQQQLGQRSGEQQACGTTAAAVEAASPAAATAALAQSIAEQLGSGPHALPVFTYGWAHPQQQPLDDIRRQLGYFSGAAASSWQGALSAAPLPLAPCHGPVAAPPRSGVCCVGAVPWLVNYNVLLHSDDLAAARAIARAVSQRGGGLPGVQAMALRHTDGIEVACNLLDPAASPPEAVLAEVRRLAAQHGGLAVGPAYRTNKSPEQLVAAAVAQGV